jgi:hypothetical protein
LEFRGGAFGSSWPPRASDFQWFAKRQPNAIGCFHVKSLTSNGCGEEKFLVKFTKIQLTVAHLPFMLLIPLEAGLL